MKKKIKPNVDAVLEMGDRYLSEWLEDIDGGIGGDHKQYLREAEMFEATKPLIESAPALIKVGKALLQWAETMGGWEAKPWRELEAIIKKAEATK